MSTMGCQQRARAALADEHKREAGASGRSQDRLHEIVPEHVASAKTALADMDRRQADFVAAAKAARHAERANRRGRAQREAEKARDAVEFIAAERRLRPSTRRKGQRPYHKATPQRIAVRHPQRTGDGSPPSRPRQGIQKKSANHQCQDRIGSGPEASMQPSFY
jgi:hypothetical protein